MGEMDLSGQNVYSYRVSGSSKGVRAGAAAPLVVATAKAVAYPKLTSPFGCGGDADGGGPSVPTTLT
jgi:hypothetical protein